LYQHAAPTGAEIMSEQVRITNLDVIRGGKSICAMNDLAIASGERILLAGSNGSGKTTLLRVIAGLEREFSGDVSIAIPQIDRVYVHQSPLLFRGTVLFNSIYALKARGGNVEESTGIAHQWLKRFDVDHFANVSSRRLSGGERRRVSLARAFAVQPKMLLLDEPFSDLDEAGQQCLLKSIDEATKTTILIASPVPISGLGDVRTIDCGDRHDG
jgi:tungstate transport system ATP-binding protein